MTSADDELEAAAQDLLAARGDDELHTVAAALRTTDGHVVLGLNLFHFTGGPCAELVALAGAAAVTGAAVDTIVAVGDRGRGVLAPCGRCRQVLLDTHPQARVLVPGPGGTRAVGVPELLPAAYRWSDGGTT